MTSTDWLTIFGITVSLVAFITGILQYREGQRWKAVEFVSSEIKEFLNNAEVQNAMMMLDYNQAPIPFGMLRGGDHPIERITVNDEMIMNAFAINKDQTQKSDELIRRSFETFFDYLVRFEHYISASGLVRYDDFHPYLNYWLRTMSPIENKSKSKAFIQQLYIFLGAYDYDYVRRLIERNDTYNKQKRSRI